MTGGRVNPTLHAALQFIIRSQQVWPTLRVAWTEAEEVEVDSLNLGDEVRYHERTNTLLICRAGVIRTVLRVDWEGRRVQAAVQDARGGMA